ncbi:MAG: FtsK/SpoIIIE domain-containing protein [Duodenibacillus massiliensis]
MNKAANALNWLVQEMDRRYNLMSHLGVRSFLSYNEKVEAAQKEGKPLMDPFQVSPDNPQPHVVLLKNSPTSSALLMNWRTSFSLTASRLNS